MAAMADDNTISDLPLPERASRYKQLAEDAIKLANETTGHARQAYSVLAEQSRIRSQQTQAALDDRQNADANSNSSDTTAEIPLPDAGRRSGAERRQGERRKEHELRRTIDEVDRMAAEARKEAEATAVPAERSQLMRAAQSLSALKAMLTGRKEKG